MSWWIAVVVLSTLVRACQGHDAAPVDRRKVATLPRVGALKVAAAGLLLLVLISVTFSLEEASAGTRVEFPRSPLAAPRSIEASAEVASYRPAPTCVAFGSVACCELGSQPCSVSHPLSAEPAPSSATRLVSSATNAGRLVRGCYEYDPPPSSTTDRQLNATKTGGKTEVWRAVEPEELADLIGSGKYRPGPGNEGKYFFPTKAQAKNLADNILPGRKFCITSGCIDSSVLAKIDKIYPAGEGQAWFIPNELLPYIDNIVIHGPA